MPYVPQRRFYIGDNLDHLVEMPDKQVDLVIIDPPFERNEKGSVIPPDLNIDSQNQFDGRWNWNEDIGPEMQDKIEDEYPTIMPILDATGTTYGTEMNVFLGFLALRLIEIKRIMKPTASIYLECSNRGGHYSKLLMDTIFGKENFRGEIIWKFKSTKSDSAKKERSLEYNSILYYTKSENYILNDMKNVKLQTNIWNDISRIGNTEFKVRKPIDLYRRIISRSSQINDLILDPFVGTCSSIIAAEHLSRKWIGMDLWGEVEKAYKENNKSYPLLEVLNGGFTIDTLKIKNYVYRQLRTQKIPADQVKELQDSKDQSVDVYYTVDSPKGVSSTRWKPRKTPNSILRDMLVKKYGKKCQACGDIPRFADYLQIDHIRPKSDGGSDDEENRALLCYFCNQAKSEKLTLSGIRERNKRHKRMTPQFLKKYNEYKYKSKNEKISIYL